MYDYAASQKIPPQYRTHRNGKPGKMAPRLARRQKGEEAKRRPSHIGLVGLRDNLSQHFRRNTRNRQLRCNKCKCLSTSKGGKFEHWFSNTVSSIFFPNSRTSNDLDWRTVIVVLVQQKGLSMDTIILISSNKVLTFGSCFKYKTDRHRTCFVMNSDKFVVCGHIGFFPKIVSPLRNPFCGIVRTGTAVRRHFVLVYLRGLRTYQAFVLYYLLSSDDPGPRDPRDPVAVEPSLCPSVFHDLAEPDPLETDDAFVSNVVTRAARLLTICSIFVIFASYEATVWESAWTQFSNLDTLCMSNGNFATCTNISLIFSSIVLARYPVPSRSGREPLGEPKFEEEAGARDIGTIVPSLTRDMRKGNNKTGL